MTREVVELAFHRDYFDFSPQHAAIMEPGCTGGRRMLVTPGE